MKRVSKKPSVEDKIIGRLQEFADALESGDAIANRFTCRTVVLELEPTAHNAKSVKGTRQLLNASQAVFARFLGVSAKTVCAWEQGVNAPSDMACRFMDEIQRNPKYWQKRLSESFVIKETA